MQAGLQQCVCRLEQQLSLLDGRVQALEKSTAGKICIERSVWEELENRVLLLETGLTLTRAQVFVGALAVLVFCCSFIHKFLAMSLFSSVLTTVM